MKICEAAEADHDEIWHIFHEVVAAGDTYAFDPDMPREDALAYWFAAERGRMSQADCMTASAEGVNAFPYGYSSRHRRHLYFAA